MTKQTNKLVTRKDFLTKNDIFFEKLSCSIFTVVFIPQRAFLEQKLPKNKEQETIEKGWSYFINEFECHSIYARIGWSLYYMLISDDKEYVLNSFKVSFQKWQMYYNTEEILWKIAFSEILNPKKDLDLAIQHLESLARKTIQYNSYYKIFQIDINTNYIKNIL